MIYKRNIQIKLEKALTRSPVVLLIGARQTGKTTLVKEVGKKNNYHYVTFDDVRFLDVAQKDPMGFIAGLSKPVILDEIQRVPELFLAIKHDVDQHRNPGCYILTGSANPLLIPRLGDSLTGRMEILTLYPFSQGELINHVDRFIDIVWQDNILTDIPCFQVSRDNLFEKMICGGYPVVQPLSWVDTEVWFDNYIITILRKDIFDLTHIEGFAAIPKLLQILAVHAGSLVNISEISRQTRIPISTLNRYIILLETLFMLFFQPAWHANSIRRTVKAPKSYLVDSGLLSWLLMINPNNFLQHQYMGHVIENFVITELRKQATWNDVRVSFSHFRTATGVEVDIIIERADGKIIGVEVKGSSHVDSRDAKSLLYLKEYAKNKWHRGFVLYTGDISIPLADTIMALPISALWSY